MKMTFDYKLLNLSPSAYKKVLDTRLKEALIEGGRIWLNAAQAIIPVWSGASHGTFIKFAALIGATLGITSSIAWRIGPAYGASQSTARKTIWGGAYILDYSTNLWHLVYNEFHNANLNPDEGRLFAKLRRPGPYHFQEKAGEIFRAFAQTVRLPSPWHTLKLVSKKVG